MHVYLIEFGGGGGGGGGGGDGSRGRGGSQHEVLGLKREFGLPPLSRTPYSGSISSE